MAVTSTRGPCVQRTVTRRLIDWLFWRNAQPVAAAQQALRPLTPRERDILLLVAAGLSDAEIAAKLSLRQTTVRSHLYHLRQKPDARDRAQLVVLVHQHAEWTTRSPERCRRQSEVAAGLDDLVLAGCAKHQQCFGSGPRTLPHISEAGRKLEDRDVFVCGAR
ncbi:response regulator transcription factor [Streptomyces viridochromogenes]|uniref:Putative two component system response regulator n=1 Tax=Streptomyces viridochromogenes Tue57 TaxID=1160705 RepID=L8PHS0_STRVR|nr:helix-turn-helix transcriptional regulator [Streptomyces viridochromogenes]ELS54942.1 putative two component system response regulator [Streptomyces viridochromogenes Tue57]